MPFNRPCSNFCATNLRTAILKAKIISTQESGINKVKCAYETLLSSKKRGSSPALIVLSTLKNFNIYEKNY